jgi:hypothetical protein
MNFFLNNFKPKGKPSPEKDVNLQKVRKFIPKEIVIGWLSSKNVSDGSALRT